jgi:DNA-binding NarL/FixJ family response regulator
MKTHSRSGKRRVQTADASIAPRRRPDPSEALALLRLLDRIAEGEDNSSWEAVRLTLEQAAHHDTILIADDDEGTRTLLVNVFEEAGYVVMAAERGDAALALARRHRPGAALLDIDMPGVSGYEVCHELRREFGSQLVIVIVSGVRTETYDRIAGLLLGADDQIAKPFDPNELIIRVRRLLERVPRVPGFDGLTPRELEVLALLADGYNQRQIAAHLVISAKTTAAHIQHVLEKLRVHSRAQAVAAAHRYGLVATDSDRVRPEQK